MLLSAPRSKTNLLFCKFPFGAVLSPKSRAPAEAIVLCKILTPFHPFYLLKIGD